MVIINIYKCYLKKYTKYINNNYKKYDVILMNSKEKETTTKIHEFLINSKKLNKKKCVLWFNFKIKSCVLFF